MTVERFNDIRDVLIALPHGDPYGATAYVQHDLFTVRYKLIRELVPAPTSVFEFGALYGYFLVTALNAAPSIKRVGWVDDESHTPESNGMAYANLISLPGRLLARDMNWWTSRDAFVESRARWSDEYDLVSIDSDHSYDGCLADLHAAHRLNPRWIFVDDWTSETHSDDIQTAVDQFLIDLIDRRDDEDDWCDYDLTEYVTVNGLAVLTRKEWA